MVPINSFAGIKLNNLELRLYFPIKDACTPYIEYLFKPRSLFLKDNKVSLVFYSNSENIKEKSYGFQKSNTRVVLYKLRKI